MRIFLIILIMFSTGANIAQASTGESRIIKAFTDVDNIQVTHKLRVFVPKGKHNVVVNDNYGCNNDIKVSTRHDDIKITSTGKLIAFYCGFFWSTFRNHEEKQKFIDERRDDCSFMIYLEAKKDVEAEIVIQYKSPNMKPMLQGRHDPDISFGISGEVDYFRFGAGTRF